MLVARLTVAGKFHSKQLEKAWRFFKCLVLRRFGAIGAGFNAKSYSIDASMFESSEYTTVLSVYQRPYYKTTSETRPVSLLSVTNTFHRSALRPHDSMQAFYPQDVLQLPHPIRVARQP